VVSRPQSLKTEQLSTTRHRQKKRTRKALLDAAVELIRQGREPTVAEVAAVGEVSRATAYRYFPTQESLLAITGQTRLLEKHPALDASIRLRLPYIEPLNLLQVELLKRHRSGENDPRVREGIQLSINAIATALRNSG